MAPSKNTLAYVILKVPRSRLQDTANFYKNGLHYVQSGSGDCGKFSFVRLMPEANVPGSTQSAGGPFSSAGVEFLTPKEGSPDVPPYRGTRGDIYWKIGVALHDVDAGVKALNERSSSLPGFRGVRQASQFVDVGHLTHMQDPAGFPIELLQTTMQGSGRAQGFGGNDTETLKRSEDKRKAHIAEVLSKGGDRGASPVAQPNGVVQGQITIRITDIGKSFDFYGKELGMQCCCDGSPPEAYGFQLYYMGYFADNENRPKPGEQDLAHMDNREWCYSRPYTTLEMQYMPGFDGRFRIPKEMDSGIHGIVVQIGDAERWERLQKKFTWMTDEATGRSYVPSPDGLKVFLEKA